MPEWVGLSSQPPDFGNALARVAQIKHMQQQGAAAQQQIDAQNRLTTLAANPDFFRRYIANDPNALAEAAGTGLPGFNMAVPRADLARQQTEFNALFGGAPPAAATPPPNQNATPASMPIGLRNNNPLNLRFAGQDGAEPGEGGFARFPTVEAGLSAAQRQLGLYASRGVNTLRGAISRWAPPSENNTDAYVTRVAQATGIDPDAPINLADPAVTQRIIPAMAQVELGQPLPAAGQGAVPEARAPISSRMPGAPTPERFAQAVQLAAQGNPMAQAFVQAWAPFMRQENPNLTAVSPEQDLIDPRTGQVIRPGNPRLREEVVTVPDPNSPSGFRYVRRSEAGGMPAPEPRAPQQTVTVGEREADKLAAQNFQQLQQGAQDANRREQIIDRLGRLLPQFRTGMDANARIAFGQAARALGFTIPGTSEGEMVRGLQRQLELALTPRGQGQITENERVLIRDQINVLGSTPEGALQLLGFAKQLSEYDRQAAKVVRDAVRANNGQFSAMAIADALATLGPRPTIEDIAGASLGPEPPANAGPGGQGTAEPPPPASGAGWSIRPVR